MKTNDIKVKNSLKQARANMINEIKEYIIDSSDSIEGAIEEITRYRESFPSEPDYNYYQHGNLLIYDDEIRACMRDCGYDLREGNWDNDDLIRDIYKSCAREAIDQLIENHE